MTFALKIPHSPGPVSPVIGVYTISAHALQALYTYSSRYASVIVTNTNGSRKMRSECEQTRFYQPTREAAVSAPEDLPPKRQTVRRPEGLTADDQ